MAKSWIALMALLLTALFLVTASADDSHASVGVDDLAVLKAHNTSAHLLALWRLGQPAAAAQLSSEQAEQLFIAAQRDKDWRVRWLASEALAQAYPTYKPADAHEGAISRPSRLSSYSLMPLLPDDCVYVREAAARQIDAEPVSPKGYVASELLLALGDESDVVRELATGRMVAELTQNPGLVENLLWKYQEARNANSSLAAEFLRDEARGTHPEAEAGRQLLASRNATLQRQERQLESIFKQAGAAIVPTSLVLWRAQPKLRREIIAAWSSIGAPAAAAGDLLVPLLADPADPLNANALFAAPDIAPLGNLKLADVLLPRVFADVKSQAIPNPAVEALQALGPLPEPYVDQVIAQIKAGIETRDNLLIGALGVIGAQSDTALSFLQALVLDDGAKGEQRSAALQALTDLARAGDVESARWVLEASRGNPDWRHLVVSHLLNKVSQSYHNRFYWQPLTLLQHPDVVAVLAQETGAVELALRAPELLQLPEFKAQVREACLAEIADPKTPPGRVIQLARLLLPLGPLPAEVGPALADILGSATLSDEDYNKTLARIAPQRARELFLANCDSPDLTTRWRAYSLLDGLGPEAAPLLDTLAARLVGEKTPGEWRAWLERPGNGKSPAPRPSVKNELDLGCRYRLAQAIGGCGPAAVTYAPYLLWALKQAYYAREQATVPVSALSQPVQLKQAVEIATGPADGLAAAITKALAALGPSALADVQRVAAGAYNDAALPYISTVEYFNPLYDQRLRNSALALLGELGAAPVMSAYRDGVAGMLVPQLGSPPEWGIWARTGDNALNQQRRIIVAEAIGQLGVANDEAVSALLTAALDDDAGLRQAAVTALRKLAGWEYPQTSEGKSI